MAKNKVPDIQQRLKRMAQAEERLMRIEAKRETKVRAMELEVRDLLKQANAATDAGDVAKARKLQDKAAKVLAKWQALQVNAK